MSLPKYPTEAKRLAALQSYALLDTPAEQAFDDFAMLASHICDTPIALLTLVDGNRQWFKARVGLEITETPREHAFCGHTILGRETMVVEDATADARFAGNPLVTSEPHIRFYAGVPLIDGEGNALGSLCAIDRKPRVLEERQYRALEALARQAVAQMQLRRTSAELATALAEVKTLHGLLPICSHCKGMRDDSGYWQSVEQYFHTHTEVDLSHSICPKCFEQHHPEIYAKVKDRLC